MTSGTASRPGAGCATGVGVVVEPADAVEAPSAKPPDDA
jgi:hypothetical protein